MSDGNRGKRTTPVAEAGLCLLAILGFVVLVYCIGSLNGKQAEQRQQQPHAHAQAVKDQAEKACLGREPATVFECVYDAIEASEDTARTEQDLTAQQRAAWAAMIGAGVAFLTMVISVAGLWFIYETLKATRDAVKEAADATEAARKAVEVTEDAAERQLRAYVGGAYVKYSCDNAEDIPTISITLKNSGQTPAIVSHMDVKVAWIVGKEVYNFKTYSEAGNFSIASQVEMSVPIPLRTIDLLTMIKGVGSLCITGEIKYLDVFGKERKTGFTYLSNSTFDPRMPCVLDASNVGFHAT